MSKDAQARKESMLALAGTPCRCGRGPRTAYSTQCVQCCNDRLKRFRSDLGVKSRRIAPTHYKPSLPPPQKNTRQRILSENSRPIVWNDVVVKSRPAIRPDIHERFMKILARVSA